MFRIHGPCGVTELVSEPERHRMRDREADQVLVTEIMTREVVCASPELPLADLIDLVVREHLGCVPIVNEAAQPVGMVTKFDIVEQLRSPSSDKLVSDVMMPLAITLDDRATVAHAAALMASEDMHHVMIVSERRLVGIVSTMDVTRWLARHEGLAR